MSAQPTEASLHASARGAGLVFLITVVGWTLNFLLVDSKIVVVGNAAQTVTNLRTHEFLFRVGLANELLFAVCGIVLAVSLYTLLEHVSRSLALLALGLKLAETILGAALVLSGFIAVQMLNGAATHVDDVIGLFLSVRSMGTTVSMVFLGLDSMLFFFLLFKSRYVPRALAGLGVVAYALIFIQSLITLLVPASAGAQTMVNALSMTMFAPSVLFELLIGFWLLFKGVKFTAKGSGPSRA